MTEKTSCFNEDKPDHRNHWQLCRKEWWLAPMAAISDLPNGHVPETYRKAVKATFTLKEELCVPEGPDRKMSPTPKKTQRALVTK